jgi:hypothetical protein
LDPPHKKSVVFKLQKTLFPCRISPAIAFRV